MNLHRGARPLVIGHRGAAAVAPPNSMAGLAAAVEAGADLVEFDVRPDLRLGHPGERPSTPPPTLGEALAFLAGASIGIHVDLKRVGVEAPVAAALRARGLESRSCVSSTFAGSLRRLARDAPELTRVVGYPRDRAGAAHLPWPRPVERAGAAALRAAVPLRAPWLLAAGSPDALALHHALVSPRLLAAARARGVAVLAWTVNEPRRVEELARLGVDAIVSDDPGMALSVLGTLGGR